MDRRFSVGDQVVVVGPQPGGYDAAYNFKEMPAYNECITEITYVSDGEYTRCPYSIEADGNRFVWSEEWLIPYSEAQFPDMDVASNEEILSMLNQEVLS